jgi:hypothetical protein
MNDAGTDKGRLAILRGMAEAVRKTGNSVLIDNYARRTALRLGVAPEAVGAEFAKMTGGKPAGGERMEEAPAEAVVKERPSMPESWLLKLVLLHEDLVEWAAAHLEVEWVQHAQARQVIERRLEAHRKGTWQNLASFWSECATPELQDLISEAGANEKPLPNPAQQLADVVLRLRNQFLDRQIAGLMQRANQPETGEGERLELLRQQQELRARKRGVLGGPKSG